MSTTSSLWSRPLLWVGLVLFVFGAQEALAQQQGQYPRGEEDRRGRQQVQGPEDEPLVHGLWIGGGLAIYQGDFTRNPEEDPLKYIAGSGRLALRAGVDHRRGTYDQYGLGIDLVYNRVAGETQGAKSWTADVVFLDFSADYELPYVRQGLFRVFAGAGPSVILSPDHEGFSPNSRSVRNGNFDPQGTRISGSAKFGVTIMGTVRIGTRITASDTFDGFEGFGGGGFPDVVSFVTINHRFNMK